MNVYYMEKEKVFGSISGWEMMALFSSKFLNPTPFVCDVIWQNREENRKSLHSYPFYGKRTDLRFW